MIEQIIFSMQKIKSALIKSEFDKYTANGIIKNQRQSYLIEDNDITYIICNLLPIAEIQLVNYGAGKMSFFTETYIPERQVEMKEKLKLLIKDYTPIQDYSI